MFRTNFVLPKSAKNSCFFKHAPKSCFFPDLRSYREAWNFSLCCFDRFPFQNLLECLQFNFCRDSNQEQNPLKTFCSHVKVNFSISRNTYLTIFSEFFLVVFNYENSHRRKLFAQIGVLDFTLTLVYYLGSL